MQPISPHDLRARLEGRDELALVDVREVEPFSKAHLLFAVPLPLGRLEVRVAKLIPRRGTKVVVCDAGEGLAQRAVVRMTELGYTDACYLEGGISAWRDAGFELFSGVNVPSKAFGEFVERESGTPSVSADELKAMLARGDDIVLLDSRPTEEFHHLCIPTGVCCPGAELVYRVHDMAPAKETTVVVNCAGRTRSIIGAQSLINAGIPNDVFALRNGTMGWQLAGYEPDHGRTEHAPAPSAEGLTRALAAAARVGECIGLRSIDVATLEAWRRDADRSLYVLDVRTRREYEAGHVPGSVHAPGGQLVQNTDSYVGTRNARIVLVDGDGVRATMTASWLLQMGHPDVVVLEGGLEAAPLATGRATAVVAGLDDAEASLVSPAVLEELIGAPGTTIVDLSPSTSYARGHLPGAWFAARARLDTALARLPAHELLVLTSTDGVVATLAAREAQALTSASVRVLDGGNRAWQDAGLPLEAEPLRLADEPDDVWQIPYASNRSDGKTALEAMQEYLTWEVDLASQIERDGTVRFIAFPRA